MTLNRRVTFWASFRRSQVASLCATAIDFGTLFFLVELGHLWYVPATAAGAALGAVTNFLMNRYWSFESTHGSAVKQGWRYAFVSVMSLIINTLGVYGLTEAAKIPYGVSKVICSIGVGVFFNFPLHRRFVFR